MTDTSEVAAYEASIEDHRNRRRDRKRTTKMVLDNAGVRNLKAANIPDANVGNRSRKKPAKR